MRGKNHGNVYDVLLLLPNVQQRREGDRLTGLWTSEQHCTENHQQRRDWPLGSCSLRKKNSGDSASGKHPGR